MPSYSFSPHGTVSTSQRTTVHKDGQAVTRRKHSERQSTHLLDCGGTSKTACPLHFQTTKYVMCKPLLANFQESSSDFDSPWGWVRPDSTVHLSSLCCSCRRTVILYVLDATQMLVTAATTSFDVRETCDTIWTFGQSSVYKIKSTMGFGSCDLTSVCDYNASVKDVWINCE